MNNQHWTVTPETKPVTEHRHTATVMGLAVEVHERGTGWITWRVNGFLGHIDISASDYHFDAGRTVEAARAAAIAAAQRLHEIGVRGTREEAMEQALAAEEARRVNEASEEPL